MSGLRVRPNMKWRRLAIVPERDIALDWVRRYALRSLIESSEKSISRPLTFTGTG